MGRARTISISNHYDRFVDERVAAGEFSSAESMIEAGLRLLEEKSDVATDMCGWSEDGTRGRPLTHESLRGEIRQGEESGTPQEVDFRALFAQALATVEPRR